MPDKDKGQSGAKEGGQEEKIEIMPKKIGKTKSQTSFSWVKMVMAIFTLTILTSYVIVVLEDMEVPAIERLTYFYKWAIVTFALLHEYQRITSTGGEKEPWIVIQGEWYIMLFIITTVALLFLNVVYSDSYPTLPPALNQMIELTIWVAGAFGFTRVSKVLNEKTNASNLAKLSNNLTKMGFKPPETPAEKKPE
jgi:hypothetical protein